MIKIDKNVPIPPNGAGPKVKYPLAELEIGDSFFMSGVKQVAISAAGWRQAPKKFITRQVTENGVAGVRVWRKE